MIQFSGHLRVRAAPRPDGRTVLAEQSFRAPFHLSKPYWDDGARTLVVQVVNPTAGILAGDQLESDIHAATGAALLVTSPSATRVFRMKDGHAECRQSFGVAAGGWLEVLPEPLVPHRGSSFRQTTAIDVEAGGSLFYVDQLLPGRIGFGEAWGWADLRLSLRVRIAGELALCERFAHTGAELEALAALAGSGPTACFANGVLIAPALVDDTTWRAELGALHQGGTWVGLSAMRLGGWTLKIVAPDSIQLRATLTAVRRILAARLPHLGCEIRKL